MPLYDFLLSLETLTFLLYITIHCGILVDANYVHVVCVYRIVVSCWLSYLFLFKSTVKRYPPSSPSGCLLACEGNDRIPE